ncbi:MAG TPA: class I SAM-dependent methyltransferase [Candidatus Egerieenecus merdigallinarum]|nr:class I SAM-dependent methyltransferase [Candidatus Egerieenecus merdigallinarum]
MFLTTTWKDFEVLDTGDGEKLERWGDVILRRPDPQTIWPKADPALWRQAQAWYHRSDKGGGEWEFFSRLPEKWVIAHEALRFYVRPTGFKHTGLFPEQAANWVWMAEKLRQSGRKDLRVLNLFGYTGGATLACAQAGAHVTHVDAAKGMVQWAKENRELSHLPETSCRWIVEDALRFVQREIRRGNSYDGILMDPPSYGRGPSGEVWKLENELYGLIDTCAQVLSPEPLFFLVNSYTTGFQASVLSNIIEKCVVSRFGGQVDSQELCLPVSTGGVLPCGATGRWFRA